MDEVLFGSWLDSELVGIKQMLGCKLIVLQGLFGLRFWGAMFRIVCGACVAMFNLFAMGDLAICVLRCLSCVAMFHLQCLFCNIGFAMFASKFDVPCSVLRGLLPFARFVFFCEVCFALWVLCSFCGICEVCLVLQGMVRCSAVRFVRLSFICSVASFTSVRCELFPVRLRVLFVLLRGLPSLFCELCPCSSASLRHSSARFALPFCELCLGPLRVVLSFLCKFCFGAL